MLSRYQRSVEKRLRERLIADENGCWLWTGPLNVHGRGTIHAGGGPRYVHRVAAWLWLGVILDGPHSVCHYCDVKHCCNPIHIYIGSPKTNSEDAVARGQQPCGERNGRTELTKKDVREIRKLLRAKASHSSVAKRFGITRSAVHGIDKRETWKHI